MTAIQKQNGQHFGKESGSHGTQQGSQGTPSFHFILEPGDTQLSFHFSGG